MELIDKEVDFHTYCATCEYQKLGDDEEPCCDCLDEPKNSYSRKPVMWKAKN